MLTERHAMFGVQPRWGLWERLLGDIDEVSTAAFPCTAAAGSAASQPREWLEQVVLQSRGTKTNGAACVCLKGSKPSAENMGRERANRKSARNAKRLRAHRATDGDEGIKCFRGAAALTMMMMMMILLYRKTVAKKTPQNSAPKTK